MGWGPSWSIPLRSLVCSIEILVPGMGVGPQNALLTFIPTRSRIGMAILVGTCPKLFPALNGRFVVGRKKNKGLTFFPWYVAIGIVARREEHDLHPLIPIMPRREQSTLRGREGGGIWIFWREANQEGGGRRDQRGLKELSNGPKALIPCGFGLYLLCDRMIDILLWHYPMDHAHTALKALRFVALCDPPVEVGSGCIFHVIEWLIFTMSCV